MKDIKYPKGEIVCTSYCKDDVPLFIITRKTLREYYYLYELVDGVFKKLGKSKNPLELEEKYKIFEKYSTYI